jgi:hypothetical protein
MKALRPSSWGMKLIDIVFAILVFCILVRVFAPSTGVGVFVHQVTHYLAIGVTYLANAIAYLLNLL